MHMNESILHDKTVLIFKKQKYWKSITNIFFSYFTKRIHSAKMSLIRSLQRCVALLGTLMHAHTNLYALNRLLSLSLIQLSLTRESSLYESIPSSKVLRQKYIKILHIFLLLHFLFYFYNILYITIYYFIVLLYFTVSDKSHSEIENYHCTH